MSDPVGEMTASSTAAEIAARNTEERELYVAAPPAPADASVAMTDYDQERTIALFAGMFPVVAQRLEWLDFDRTIALVRDMTIRAIAADRRQQGAAIADRAPAGTPASPTPRGGSENA